MYKITFIPTGHIFELPDETAKELKQFSEIGVQRFFIQNREKNEDEELEIQRIINETEGLE